MFPFSSRLWDNFRHFHKDRNRLTFWARQADKARKPFIFGLGASLLIGLCALFLIAAARDSSSEYNDRIGQSYNFLFGKNPYLPSQAKLERTGFISPEEFPTAGYCQKCHEEAHRQWRESAHANSFRAPFYKKNVDMLIQQKGIEYTRHCEGCHNPIALLSG